MPTSKTPIKFNSDFDPKTGVACCIAPGIQRVTAPNPNAYTFTGTNSYLIGTQKLAIVDPGPNSAAHLKALIAAIDGRPVEAILLTHTHKDHSAGIGALAKIVKAPVWFGGKHRLSRPKRLFEVNSLARSCDWDLRPDRILNDGDVFSIDGISLQTIATPGHCANHLAFGVVGTPFLFSGDHIMGWSSTLVAVPDGSMTDYFASLDKIIDADWDQFFPGHGGPIENGRIFTDQLKDHRNSRNKQILNALAGGDDTIRKLVCRIYPNLPLANRIAAGMTLHAHLEYLISSGKVKQHFRPFSGRYALV